MAQSRAGEGSASPAIIRYWHADEAPDYVDALWATFRDHNPGVSCLAFNERTADEFIGDCFTSREVAAFRACAVPAMQADYLRYCAVLELGGFYCDVDQRCVGSIGSLLTPRGGQLFRRDALVFNSPFAFRPRHPLLEMTLEIATRNIEQRLARSVFFVTGPAIFTGLARAVEFRSMDDFVDDAQTFRGGILHSIARSISQVADLGRIVAALTNVKISALEETRHCLEGTGGPLPYKATTAHWTQWKRPIYQDAGDGFALRARAPSRHR